MGLTAREAKLRITGDSTSATRALGQVDKSVNDTAKGISQATSLLRTFGALMVAREAGRYIKQQVDLGQAVGRVGDHLQLTQSETQALHSAMADLGRRLAPIGVTTEDLGGILVQSALDIHHLGGELPVAARLTKVLETTFNFAHARGMDFNTALEDMVGLLAAWRKPAEDVASVAQTLYEVWRNTGRPIEDLMSDLEEIGPLAADTGESFNALASALGTAPEAKTLLESALAIKKAAQEGKEEAQELLRTLGLDVNSPVIEVAQELASALAEGRIQAGDLKGLLSTATIQHLVDQARDLERALGNAVALKEKLDKKQAEGTSADFTETPTWLDRAKDAYQDSLDRTLAADMERHGAMGASKRRLLRYGQALAEGAWAGVTGGGAQAAAGNVFGFAGGGVVTRATPGIFGEAGAEALVPLDRFGGMTPQQVARAFDIPLMASGGIVTKPTLVMAGEAGAEAIVPLGRGGAGGGATHIHVNKMLLPGVRDASSFARDLQRQGEFEAQYGKLGSRRGDL